MNGHTHTSYKQHTDGWTVINLPYKQPDPLVPVVRLEMTTDHIQTDSIQGLDPELGLPALSVLFAQTEKCNVYKSSWMEKFGEWKHTYCTDGLDSNGQLTWIIHVMQPGTYNVQVEARGNERTVWRLETDEKQMLQNQQRVSSLFTKRPLGWIQFKKPGVHTLTLSMPEGGRCEVASVSLTPIYIEY